MQKPTSNLGQSWIRIASSVSVTAALGMIFLGASGIVGAEAARAETVLAQMKMDQGTQMQPGMKMEPGMKMQKGMPTKPGMQMKPAMPMQERMPMQPGTQMKPGMMMQEGKPMKPGMNMKPGMKMEMASEGVFDGVGKVIALVPAMNQVVVGHEAIKGFMEAMPMGMGYEVESAGLLKGLKPGDRIKFKIDAGKKKIVAIETLR